MWSREPNLMIALLLCTIISVVLDVVGVRVIGLSRSIVYPIIIVADIAILVSAALKISAANRRAAEARRKAYQQKFGTDRRD